MLDTAVIGGGLCGLALAHSLQARGDDWRLFEARPRLGGRVLTAHAEDAPAAAPIDLGATWFWPRTQPAITRLVADLGLTAFDQLDDGRVLHLADPGRAAASVALTPHGLPAADGSVPAQPGTVHGHARRVAGSMGAVIGALAKRLPAHRVRLGHQLVALIDRDDGVELRLRWGESAYSLKARRVVLALPPRVAAAQVQFTPALDPAVVAALHATPTWMATAAKAGVAYPRAFWREAGHTGNAWVGHAQAMLAETFDACAADGGGAALAGFCALGPAQRVAFARGRDLLLESQLVQLYGPQAAQPTASHWHDWALDPLTCTPLDLADELAGAPAHPHRPYGDPLLTAEHWAGRLFFGGSETARQGGGYLEGALGAAGRLRRQLLSAPAGAEAA